MRVDPNFVNNLVPAIDRSSAREDALTQQLSSGLRVSTLADDPLAVGQGLILNAAISRADTFVQNASREQALLQATDAVLGEAVTQITGAVGVAVRGANGTLNAAELAAHAQELTGIRDHLLALANTNYLGQYLFGGSKSSTAPFVLDTTASPAVASYTGDSKVQTMETPDGQTIPLNLPGGPVFAAAGGSVLGALNKLIADFSGGSAAANAAVDTGALTAALGVVTQQRSIVGSSLNALTTNSTWAQTQETQYKVRQSSLLASDTAQVATDLRTAETQHQALLSVVGALGKGSLFDYLR